MPQALVRYGKKCPKSLRTWGAPSELQAATHVAAAGDGTLSTNHSQSHAVPVLPEEHITSSPFGQDQSVPAWSMMEKYSLDFYLLHMIKKTVSKFAIYEHIYALTWDEELQVLG